MIFPRKRNIQTSNNKPVQQIHGRSRCIRCDAFHLPNGRTLKYWKKVVFSIFARMVLNSYIIYKENTSGRIMSRIQFTSSIIQAIEEEWLAEKSNNSISLVPMKQADDALLRKLPGRNLRRCVVCSNKDGGSVKRSNTVCAKFEKGLHGLCGGKHSC